MANNFIHATPDTSVHERYVPGRSISRILYGKLVTAVTIYLGGLSPTHSCSLPGTQGKRAASHLLWQTLSLLDLAPDGGYPAAALLPALVVSYTTISPLPARRKRLSRRYLSVALFRQVTGSAQRASTSPHPGCYPASCPVECGLSSARRTEPRSPDRPGILSYRDLVVGSNGCLWQKKQAPVNPRRTWCSPPLCLFSISQDWFRQRTGQFCLRVAQDDSFCFSVDDDYISIDPIALVGTSQHGYI